MSAALLVDDIHTYYGASYVLQGLSLEVRAGDVVALLGRNGMGKTTTMRSIMGFSAPRSGKIYLKGEEITGLSSFKISRRGISLVPQGRRLFSSLSVRENLQIAAIQKGRRELWNMEKVMSLFPVLKARLDFRATKLSGGEQQMLAIARGLISNPDALLEDEPSEGLAPLIIEHIVEITERLKEDKISILLAEQNVPMALKVADYVYIINKGKIAFHGTPGELNQHREIEQEYLAV